MKLISYLSDGTVRAGAIVGDRVLPLPALTVEDLVSSEAALAAARVAVASAIPADLPLLADVELLPPVTPGKILCVGYNYRGHVPAGGDVSAPDPQYPDIFVKTANVLVGPQDAVPLHPASVDVDYEGEVALVIGKRAHQVSLETAGDYIAGYSIFNDVSDREWQGRSSQWELGKCFDGFGPLGPAVVTADEVGDPHALTVEVVRDGIVTVSQSTADMVFSMPFLVHYISQVMTLEPGDIIATGSPQKLPEALAVHRRLIDGDSVTVRVTGLGELSTTFVTSGETP